jgi:hypothetical protein
MAFILRIGYRHLEAIRAQTITVAMGLNWSRNKFDFREWLTNQAPHLLGTLDRMQMPADIPLAFDNERHWHYAILLNSLLHFYEADSPDSSIQARYKHSIVSTSLSDHRLEDYAGADKGGAWHPDPFAFRAGIILTLGALEEFERGTLRILTGLRHASMSYSGASEAFRPRLADFEAPNPIWAEYESKKKTFTAAGRMKILGTFGIDRPNTKWRRRLDRASRRRNQIAHGLVPVKATLAMFLRTHYDAFTAMRWLSRACRKAQNVLL